MKRTAAPAVAPENITAEAIEQALRTYVNPVKREYLPRFFKTGKGEYGEGDRFLGVVVPDTRRVARQYIAAPFDVTARLLLSPWHECRLCALLILVERFKKCDEKGQKEIFDFYLSHTAYINNWDLVDLSAPGIVGQYLAASADRSILHRLARNPLLWDQRIAVVSTLTFIRNHDFTDIYLLAEHFLDTRHDLMQKAVGWMLREAGKRDCSRLVEFLNLHAARMPRTMLRYAIEKFPEGERKEYMKMKN